MNHTTSYPFSGGDRLLGGPTEEGIAGRSVGGGDETSARSPSRSMSPSSAGPFCWPLRRQFRTNQI